MKHVLLALDVGEKRIGVAIADSIGRLAAPLTTLEVDGTEVIRLQRLLLGHEITHLVVGLPRNMQGEETAQSQLIRQFVKLRLQALGLPISFQDESLTSVAAETALTGRKRGFTKADIDAHAATLILQDYLDAHYG